MPCGFVYVGHLWWQAGIWSWHWSTTHFLHSAQTSWCRCGTPVSWTARGRQRSHKTQQQQHLNILSLSVISLLCLLPSLFLLSPLMIYLPLKPILTRLQSSVLVLSLSSVMKIMLLLFFFFLLFLSLTSASPTVTTTSSAGGNFRPGKSTVFCFVCHWRVKEVGDSGGRSLGGGRKGVN